MSFCLDEGQIVVIRRAFKYLTLGFSFLLLDIALLLVWIVWHIDIVVVILAIMDPFDKFLFKFLMLLLSLPFDYFLV